MLNSKPPCRWNYIKIISLFFPQLAVVWTPRWAVVKNYAAIVRISSELVEISSEPVRNSSELVSTISELLKISVFRKTLNSVSRTLIPPCPEAKGELCVFTFVYPFIKSALRALSSELLHSPTWLEVILWGTSRNVRQKNGGWHLQRPLATRFLSEPQAPTSTAQCGKYKNVLFCAE